MAVEEIKVVPPERLNEVIDLIGDILTKYVKAVPGKNLSEEDFTSLLKNKLEEMTPDDYITEEELGDAVADLAGIKLKRVDTYEALLIGYGTGASEYKSKNTIYLVGTTPVEDEASGATNVYEEYLYLGDEATETRPYEKIGTFTTSVDLSEYIKRSEIKEMTAEELQQKWKSVFPDEE